MYSILLFPPRARILFSWQQVFFNLASASFYPLFSFSRKRGNLVWHVALTFVAQCITIVLFSDGVLLDLLCQRSLSRPCIFIIDFNTLHQNSLTSIHVAVALARALHQCCQFATIFSTFNLIYVIHVKLAPIDPPQVNFDPDCATRFMYVVVLLWPPFSYQYIRFPCQRNWS